jgi:hypothetical protein
VMRQHDPRERRGLAKVHRGEPDSYLELKADRGQLRVFTGEQPATDAEGAAIAEWAAARERYGNEQAVLICRENQRRERLNELARARLRDRGELGESVEIAGREWAVGDRVIARRNDRGRDLDNGMRATITRVDERNGLTVEVDSGAERVLDVDYVAHHVQHAYALTGHGIQGGTVEWAGVVGQPGDFTRNWSYTALSRAREPTLIWLIDEPTRAQQARIDVAPAEQAERRRDPVGRMSRRMRERDDEDLALEQLERADPRRELEPDSVAAIQPAPQQPDPEPPELRVSPTRARIYELDAQLADVQAQLASPHVDDARRISELQATIAAVGAEHERDRRPQGWRDRAGHQTRTREREQHLQELDRQRETLLARTPDPEAVTQRVQQLAERRRGLASERLELRPQAVADELDARPPWLERTLGPEPQDPHAHERWQRTAREIAGYRVDHHINDPDNPLGLQPRSDPSSHATQRSITDTRAALGIDTPSSDQDLELGT